MNRKTFIKTGLGASFSFILGPQIYNAKMQDPKPLDVSLVEEFVRAGHSNLANVKKMLKENPNLIYAKYDWGNGDFESAIEGAGHLGNKEIANYLIGQGARVNLFVLTMLGKTNLVIPTLEAYPGLLQAQGAHGFTLLHHAQKGGNDAKDILEYLNRKGLSEGHIELK